MNHVNCSLLLGVINRMGVNHIPNNKQKLRENEKSFYLGVIELEKFFQK